MSNGRQRGGEVRPASERGSRTMNAKTRNTVLNARRWVAMALLVWTTVASADDFPVLKPGLWEYERTTNSVRSPSKPPAQSFTQCTSPSEDMKNKWKQLAGGACRFTPIEREGNRHKYRSMCRRNDQEVLGASVIDHGRDRQQIHGQYRISQRLWHLNRTVSRTSRGGLHCSETGRAIAEFRAGRSAATDYGLFRAPARLR